jgi:hypothetical protein
MKHTAIIFALLCIILVVAGCKQSDDDIYEELIHLRFEAEKEVLGLMELYREVSEKARRGQAELRRYLGDNSHPETIRLFQRGTDIPLELSVAYSRWLTLLPTLLLLEQITDRVEAIKNSRLLEEMDVAILTIENGKKLGRVEKIDRHRIDQLDQLFSRLLNERSLNDMLDTAEQEKRAIARLKSQL